jgi:hypothetical protein
MNKTMYVIEIGEQVDGSPVYEEYDDFFDCCERVKNLLHHNVSFVTISSVIQQEKDDIPF